MQINKIEIAKRLNTIDPENIKKFFDGDIGKNETKIWYMMMGQTSITPERRGEILAPLNIDFASPLEQSDDNMQRIFSTSRSLSHGIYLSVGIRGEAEPKDIIKQAYEWSFYRLGETANTLYLASLTNG